MSLQTLEQNDSAGTNIPHCINSWAKPDQSECPGAVHLALGPKKQNIFPMLLVGAARKFVQMRYEYHSDPLFRQGGYNLLCDLRTFAFIGCRKGFIEQNHGIWLNMIDNVTHPTEFLIEFSTFHVGVFFPLVMRENVAADTGAKRLGRMSNVVRSPNLRVHWLPQRIH